MAKKLPDADGYVVRMKGITKAFPGVLALDGVDFQIKAGEVHALIGENGAGKSTLSKILTGVYTKDAGEIEVRGQSVEIQNPLDAQRLGIRIIHQEFNLISHMSIMENMFLENLGHKLGDWFPTGRCARKPRKCWSHWGWTFPLTAWCGS